MFFLSIFTGQAPYLSEIDRYFILSVCIYWHCASSYVMWFIHDFLVGRINCYFSGWLLANGQKASCIHCLLLNMAWEDSILFGTIQQKRFRFDKNSFFLCVWLLLLFLSKEKHFIGLRIWWIERGENQKEILKTILKI